MVEVHPVQSGDEAHWHEERRDDGQRFHDFVLTRAQDGEVGVPQVRARLAARLAARLDSIKQLMGVVVAVAKEKACAVGNDIRVAADQLMNRFVVRPEHSPQLQQPGSDDGQRRDGPGIISDTTFSSMASSWLARSSTVAK